MDLSELRIGNYYLDCAGCVAQVTLETFGMLALGANIIKSFVLLSDEQIQSLGFRHPDGCEYYIHSSNLNTILPCLRIVDVFSDGNYTVSIGDNESGVIFREIQFTHQLQNIYFEINHKELTFSPRSKGGESVTS